MRRRVLNTPVAWLALLLTGCLLFCLGCETAEPPPPAEINYTYDSHTHELINLLAGMSQANPYKDFNQRFSGLFVPASLFAMEPFVLGLSTESRIPAILLMEAHWVSRYGRAGWLHELEPSQVKLTREDFAPQIVEAFSLALTDNPNRQGKALMAMPTSIRGNVLFYRRDLLERYQLAPPRNWEELKAICGKILPREKPLKYGLLLHPVGLVNDFYPILWGFGGRVTDGNQVVLAETQNQAAFLAALKEILGMQGTILPSARDLGQFEAEEALTRAFLQGEALFMINWNTRLDDLRDALEEGKNKLPGGLAAISQVGVAPIPSRAGNPRRYTNLDSLGWAVNSFAANAWNGRAIMEGVKEFLQLVINERFQILAADTWGEVPSLNSALKNLKNPPVLEVYNRVFAAPDVEIRMRPHSRRVNNSMEKQLRAALYGQQTPEATLQGLLQELK